MGASEAMLDSLVDVLEQDARSCQKGPWSIAGKRSQVFERASHGGLVGESKTLPVPGPLGKLWLFRLVSPSQVNNYIYIYDK